MRSNRIESSDFEMLTAEKAPSVEQLRDDLGAIGSERLLDSSPRPDVHLHMSMMSIRRQAEQASNRQGRTLLELRVAEQVDTLVHAFRFAVLRGGRLKGRGAGLSGRDP